MKKSLSMDAPTFQVTKEAILEGLEKKQFEVYYQPIVDKKREIVTGSEALIRWNHPYFGLLFPKSFIKTAEEGGIIDKLGEYVIGEVCRYISTLPENEHEKVNINVSVYQLISNNFVNKVEEILHLTKINPRCLGFEIVETGIMKNTDEALIIFNHLRTLGVRIYLDDFGSGYSNLERFNLWSFDGIKVSGSLLHSAIKAKHGLIILKHIIKLARYFNIEIVMEGVESEEHLLILKDMDCDLMQGYYFAYPLPLKEYKEWKMLYSHIPVLRM